MTMLYEPGDLVLVKLEMVYTGMILDQGTPSYIGIVKCATAHSPVKTVPDWVRYDVLLGCGEYCKCFGKMMKLIRGHDG